MIYPITAYGAQVLKKRAKDIEKGSDIKELISDMFETMYSANGVGLAAPQIGKGMRIFVVDGEGIDDESTVGFKKVFINPQIVEEKGEEWNFEEGCLSIPGIREDVLRQDSLRIHFFDENWVEHEEEFDGIPARIIQHEYDHLEGILFTDHLTAFKKRLLKGKLTNISKGKVEVDYRMSFPLRK